MFGLIKKRSKLLTFHWFREAFVCKPFPDAGCSIAVARTTAIDYFRRS